MGNGGAISFAESAVYSGLGLTVVFLALVSLAVMIIIFSKVFSSLNTGSRESAKSPATAAAAGIGGEDLETLAAVLASVIEDANARREPVIVTSINEVK
ncbi:MAG: hypothetical protein Pg6C_19940 [Treponemataceae bacterium]|nr:MAG: hypothetical protein Pg6C_19940 [Treponemataceae bacterium]